MVRTARGHFSVLEDTLREDIFFCPRGHAPRGHSVLEDTLRSARSARTRSARTGVRGGLRGRFSPPPRRTPCAIFGVRLLPPVLRRIRRRTAGMRGRTPPPSSEIHPRPRRPFSCALWVWRTTTSFRLESIGFSSYHPRTAALLHRIIPSHTNTRGHISEVGAPQIALSYCAVFSCCSCVCRVIDAVLRGHLSVTLEGYAQPATRG